MNNLNILNNSTDCNNQIFIPHMCAYTIRVDRWFVIIIYICTYIIIYFTTYAPVKYCTLIMCNPKLHEGNLNFWFSTQKQRLNSLSFKSSISGSWLIFLIAENCSTLSQFPALVLFDTFTVMNNAYVSHLSWSSSLNLGITNIRFVRYTVVGCFIDGRCISRSQQLHSVVGCFIAHRVFYA